MRGMIRKIVLGISMAAVLFTSIPVPAHAEAKSVDILFIHDLHSYLDGYTSADRETGENQPTGGVARMKTVIDRKKAENPDTLLLDGGDISMGTLYQTLVQTEAVELRMLGRLGFDATTFGNHDFDYGSEPLADMYRVAAASDDPKLAFIVNNIDWTSDNAGSREIYEALQEYGLYQYIVLNRNGVKIAITGTLGVDAINCAPRCELTWLDPVEYTKQAVETIKAKENPDMIICLSHSGVDDDPEKSEDEILAKEVPDLDVIISGHTHTVLDEPRIVGNTTIASCGCYGYYLGSCQFEQNADGRWTCTDYENIELDDSVPEDPDILASLDEFSEHIDDQYTNNYGYDSDEVVAVNNITFESVDDMYFVHTEHRLGNYMSDAYRYAVNTTPSGKEHPADIGVCPSGTVRDTYYEGEITAADIFRSFSLGSGADGSVGYPIISLYLTGAELRNVAEIDATVSDLMTSARLYFSGLCLKFNPHRMVLNKTEDCWLTAGIKSDERVEIEDDKLYRVVTDLYSGEMLGQVNSMSYGLLAVVPKDENGVPYENLEDAIVYKADGSELKTWEALAMYMESFDRGADGEPRFDAYYAETHGRKVVDESRSLSSLLSSPNKFFFMIVGAVLVVILLIVLIVLLIVKLIKVIVRSVKKKRNAQSEKKE